MDLQVQLWMEAITLLFPWTLTIHLKLNLAPEAKVSFTKAKGSHRSLQTLDQESQQISVLIRVTNFRQFQQSDSE